AAGPRGGPHDDARRRRRDAARADPMSAVLQMISGRRDDLRPVQARIADVVLAHPAAAARLTLDQVADAADCSHAAVTNFAHDLGYSGFRAYRSALLAVDVRA